MSADEGGRMNQWLLALCAWTLFVWTNRIRNVFAEPDLVVVDLIAPVVFCSVALLGVAGVLLAHRSDRSLRSSGPAWLRPLAVGLAVAGSLWWLVRGSQILLGDWSLGFKVVHTILALVVVGLSAMTLRPL